MSAPIQYSDLSTALSHLGYTEEPSGFHGALCGALCMKEPQAVDVSELLEVGGTAEAEDFVEETKALLRLRGESAIALGSAEMSFMPLLPGDDQELAARITALAAWCEGFLYGLSTGRTLNMKRCSPEMKEILRDLTQFTQAGLGQEDDHDIEEAAYAELVEYVRVGVQLIFMELHGHSTADDELSENTTLH